MKLQTHSANFHYLEDLYEAYRKNPASVDPAWQAYFAELGSNAPESVNGNGHAPASSEHAARAAESIAPTLVAQLNEMIQAFRTYGHLAAQIDPLALHSANVPELDPAFYGFSTDRMEQLFPAVGLPWLGPLSLHEIIQRLQSSYCGPIGIEFMHIEDRRAREWLAARIESVADLMPKNTQLKILTQLIHATSFEEFIRSQFVGAKSFSLEGGETLITLLKTAMEKTAQEGIREIVLAMAHRGRLNVLVNVVGKKPREVFREFIDAPHCRR